MLGIFMGLRVTVPFFFILSTHPHLGQQLGFLSKNAFMTNDLLFFIFLSSIKLSVKFKFLSFIFSNFNIDSKNISEKGKNLENLAVYLLNCTKEFKVTGKREKTNRGELDVCCCNISNDSVLWKLGAFIFVECKNWNRKVNVKVIRELGYIMFNKGNSTTILFSSNGITKDAKKEIRKLAVKSKFIIHIDKNNLEQFQSAEDFVDFIKYKYFSLQKETENDLELLG